MSGSLNEEMIERLIDLVSQVKKVPMVRKDGRLNSYYLKHVFERRFGEYVSNEEMIEACRRAGFECKRMVEGSPNRNFNMSIGSLRDLFERMIGEKRGREIWLI